MDHNIGAHSYFWTNLIIFNPKKGFYFFCSIMDVRCIIHSNKMLLNILKINVRVRLVKSHDTQILTNLRISQDMVF
jgi:hypothetical protein